MELKLSDIELAAQRIGGAIHRTELDLSSTFSAATGGQVYLKCENRQKTGSFKIRGATNKLAVLSTNGGVSSVVASSAGNHAQGVACAAAKLGIPATIVMPATAPIAKVQATKGYGANVVLCGDCYDDAYAKAKEICESEGSVFLHPYNDIDVIAGQGTLGLEIIGELPTVDMIIVPAGGGGLLAGIASCVKQINPRIRVIGVQAEGCDPIYRSFKEKRYICAETSSTIADGISVKTPGDITMELINKYVDDIVTVDDNEISEAILLLMERCKQIVEPSGATPVAAILKKKIDVCGKRVVCVLSGGNIDVSFVQCIIEQGLVARGRRLQFTVTLLDKPGSLSMLLNELASLGANILSLEHDRLSPGLNPNETNVHVSCEVGGREHGQQVVDELKKNGFKITINNGGI